VLLMYHLVPHAVGLNHSATPRVRPHLARGPVLRRRGPLPVLTGRARRGAARGTFLLPSAYLVTNGRDLPGPAYQHS
jgi:hypothetical protein